MLLLITAAYAGAESSAGVVMVPGWNGSANCVRSGEVIPGTPEFSLIPQEAGARTGKVWVQSGWDGICIEGKVNGPVPEWAAKPSELLTKDHVEVWLATAPQVAMPPIGWGNQFGEAKLKNAADCAKAADSFQDTGATGKAKCRAWYAKQVHYRALLRRLFVRQWVIGGANPKSDAGAGWGRIEEEFATQAWRELEANYFRGDLPVQLKPREFDGVEASAGNSKAGYAFTVFIPYSAFPPMPHAELRDFWLMVDVFDSAPAGRKTGPYSTTSARRTWGEPATFNHVELEQPVRYMLSPCEAPLTEENMYGDKLPAWFFPVEPKGAKGGPVVIRKDFVLANPAGGYLYQPGGMSPEVVVHTHFWKKLGAGEWVCGPDLLLLRDGVTHVTPYLVEKDSLDVKHLPGGGLLVRSGPYSAPMSQFGAGQCGGCTVANLNFYTIAPDGKAGAALELNPALMGYPGQPNGVDFNISPDWKVVTEYLQIEGKKGWVSKKYCFDGVKYKKCGGSSDVNPPNPPHYPQYSPPSD